MFMKIYKLGFVLIWLISILLLCVGNNSSTSVSHFTKSLTFYFYTFLTVLTSYYFYFSPYKGYWRYYCFPVLFLLGAFALYLAVVFPGKDTLFNGIYFACAALSGLLPFFVFWPAYKANPPPIDWFEVMTSRNPPWNREQ